MGKKKRMHDMGTKPTESTSKQKHRHTVRDSGSEGSSNSAPEVKDCPRDA